jgi:hypothetical protein
MTKQAWQEHYKTHGPHDGANCAECQARKRTKRASRRTAYTVAGAIHAADFIGTELCLGRGCSEGNTWAPVNMQKRGWRAASQVVGTVGTAEAVHYASKHSPLSARIVLGAVVAMKGAAVGSAVSYRISWQRRRALLK